MLGVDSPNLLLLGHGQEGHVWTDGRQLYKVIPMAEAQCRRGQQALLEKLKQAGDEADVAAAAAAAQAWEEGRPQGVWLQQNIDGGWGLGQC